MSIADCSIHPSALVATKQIGSGTRIWAFCNVLPEAVIGQDVNIGDHCFVENDVIIGDRVTIKNGVSLWDGVTLEDDVFVGPNAVFTNDVYPRSKIALAEPARTVVRKGATIGANATIVAGHVIGRYALIGAGSVITKDVPDFAKWVGNPGRRVGYVCRAGKSLEFDKNPSGEQVAAGANGEQYCLSDGLVTLVEG